MAIANGQAVDAANSNAAWASKSADNTLTGVQTLNHPTSGGTITNAQQEINDLRTDVTAIEADNALQDTAISDLQTLSGVTANSTDLGSFTGSTIPDNSTIKDAIQAVETEVETKIDSSEKGAANGVAELDAGGKVPVGQLPASVLGALSYQGTWNASTNTPALSDGTGSKGYYYVVTVAGTQNLGSGNITFDVGDWVVHNGTIYERLNDGDVESVNGQVGAVVLDTDDINEGATNLYFTNARADARIAAASIDDLSDVDTTTTPPSDGQALVWDSGNSEWVPGTVAASGGGDVNYLGDIGTADVDASGWTTYADAAGIEPVDASGGAPTITWTRTTTNPMNGAGSFRLTKDAANRQGEGVASDVISVPLKEQYKVNVLKMVMRVQSGTYTDDALRIYIKNETSGAFIYPTINTIKNLATGYVEKIYFTFQLQDTLDYRVVFHIAGTDANAYNLEFDDIEWTASSAVQAASTKRIKLTKSSNQTISVSTATLVTFQNVIYDDAGMFDSVNSRIYPKFNGKGTLTASASYQNGSAETFSLQIWKSVAGAASTLVYSKLFLATTGATPDRTESLVYEDEWNVGDYYELKIDSAADTSYDVVTDNTFFALEQDSFEPIPGTYANRGIVCSAHKNGTNQTISAATEQQITLSTASVDVAGLFDNANDRITCLFNGIVKVRAKAVYSGLTSGEKIITRTKQNSTTVIEDKDAADSAGDAATFGARTLNVVAGDTFSFYCDSAADTNYDVSGQTYDTYLEVEYLKMDQFQIPSEKVVAVYTSAAGTTYGNGTTTILDFATKVKDSHNTITTGASWKFEPPKNGDVKVSAVFTSNAVAASAIANGARLAVYKNGSEVRSKGYIAKTTTSISHVISVEGVIIPDCTPSDDIDVRLINGIGATLTKNGLATENWICIEMN